MATITEITEDIILEPILFDFTYVKTYETQFYTKYVSKGYLV